MRITESIDALWSSRRLDAPAERARTDEVRRSGPPPAAAQINVLDTDHDGWIDEDDLPYDQLLLLERARAAEAAEPAGVKPAGQPAAQPPEHVPPAPAAAVEVPVPRPEPAPPAAAQGAPRVDLLA